MRLLIAAVLMATLPAAAAENSWATAADYLAFQIYLGEDANPLEHTAADELATHWEMATGHAMPITNRPDAEKFNLWVGGGKKIEGLFAPGDLENLGEDGIFIRTMSDQDLLLIGGGDFGTLYAVYEFLEQYLGVRWLTPSTTYVPETPRSSIPRISFQFKPVFEYRYSTFLNAVPDAKPWQRRMRWKEGPGFACHSLYSYIAPENYFAEHPAYFSEVDGQRIAPHDFNWHDYKTWPEHREQLGQLCMTNEEMLAIVADKVKEGIRQHPEDRMPHLSQMDWQNYCTCARCAAIDSREGTHAASTLWGLNWIAERVAEDFPEYGIETLAYQYTRTPPANMEVRDNVAVKLCTIECDFSTPLDDPDSVLNAAFAEDLRGWAEKAERLHIWNYSANFKNFQQPYPSFHVLQENLQFFQKNKVKGIFEQGSYDHGGGFAYLRAYMLSKLMWHPYRDAEMIRDEFLDLYYREAAPFLREYIDLITSRVQPDDVYMRCFDYGDWMNYDTVVEAEGIFRRAFEAVDSEEIRARLDLAYLPVQFAALKCPPKITVTEDTFTLTRPPSLTLEAYLERIDELGITHIVDYKDREAFLRQIGGITPPREQESRLIKLNNGTLEVWVLPEMGGTIVRIRDIRNDTEWLRGFEHWGHINGVSRMALEEEMLPPFTVLESNDSTLVLETTLENGVQLRSTLAFSEEEAGELLHSVTLTNMTDKSIEPQLTSLTELYTQHANEVSAEATGGEAGALSYSAAQSKPDRQTFATSLPASYTDAALVFGEKGRKLEVRALQSTDSIHLFCDARPDRAHFNVELSMDSALLAPQEARESHYRWFFGK